MLLKHSTMPEAAVGLRGNSPGKTHLLEAQTRDAERHGRLQRALDLNLEDPGPTHHTRPDGAVGRKKATAH